MLNQNQVPLAAEEQALSHTISQLAACVHQDVQSLSGLDVGVQSTVLQGLTAKVQEQLRQYRYLLGDLKHAAEEQETPDQTERVAYVLGKHQSDYDSLHKAFQDARMHFERRKEQSYRQQRQELIGSVDFSQRQQKFATEQEAVLGAQDVTASLRRTRQLMAQNLEQTHGNISVIAASNKRLQAAGDELTGQKDIFKESHGLLGTLKTQSILDKFAMWGGFTFFMLVVLYISFKRTPAFMKQPLYSLLHMKPTGKPFDHQDYAAANIPPGTFKPSDQPWAGGGSVEQAYPADWAAWDAGFADMPGHGEVVYKDSDWQELLNEGLQQETGDAYQRGPDGSLRPLQPTKQQQQQQQLRRQQQTASGEPQAPGTPGQHQPSDTWGCSATDEDGHCQGGAYDDVAGFQPGQQPTAAPIPVSKAHFDSPQQHEDEDEVAFQSGAAYHPSDESAGEHINAHWTVQQQHHHHNHQPGASGLQQPPAALGIIDPEAAAAAAVSSPATGEYELDPDELEFQQKHQEQQQQMDQERLLLEQQNQQTQQQQQEQEQTPAESVVNAPAASETVTHSPGPTAAEPSAMPAAPANDNQGLTTTAADGSATPSESLLGEGPASASDASATNEEAVTATEEAAGQSPAADTASQSSQPPAADVIDEQQQADHELHTAPTAVQVEHDAAPPEPSLTTGAADASPPLGAPTVGSQQLQHQPEVPRTDDNLEASPAGDLMHSTPSDQQQPAADQQQQQQQVEWDHGAPPAQLHEVLEHEPAMTGTPDMPGPEQIEDSQQQQQQQQQQGFNGDQGTAQASLHGLEGLEPPAAGASATLDEAVVEPEQQQQDLKSAPDPAGDMDEPSSPTMQQQQQPVVHEVESTGDSQSTSHTQQPLPPSFESDATASEASDVTRLPHDEQVSNDDEAVGTAAAAPADRSGDVTLDELESLTGPAGTQQQQHDEQAGTLHPPVVDVAEEGLQEQQLKQQETEADHTDTLPEDLAELGETYKSSEQMPSETWDSSEPDATVIISTLASESADEVKQSRDDQPKQPESLQQQPSESEKQQQQLFEGEVQEQQSQQQPLGVSEKEQQLVKQQEGTHNMDQPEVTVADAEQQLRAQEQEATATQASEMTDSAPPNAPAANTPVSEEAASAAAQQVAAGLSAAAADIVAAVQPELDAVGLNAKVQQALQAKGQKFLSKLRNRLSEKGAAVAAAAPGGSVAGRRVTVTAGDSGDRSIMSGAVAAEVLSGAGVQDSVYGDHLSYHKKAAVDMSVQDAVSHHLNSAHGLPVDWDVEGAPAAADGVQSLSQLIEQEQQAAFSIMDMDDVGLYHYEETAEGGKRLTRKWTADVATLAADTL